MANDRWALDLNELSFGQKGGDIISSTSTAATTGAWGAIYMLSSAQLTDITISGVNNSSHLLSPFYAAGQAFYGYITSIDVSTGYVFAYTL